MYMTTDELPLLVVELEPSVSDWTRTARVCIALVLAMTLLCGSAPAYSQELPTMPRPRPALEFPGTTKEVGDLSTSYLSGDWVAFSRTASGVLARVGAACIHAQTTDPSITCPARRDFILLVWVATIPSSADPVILSAVMQRSIREPYSRVLPGLQEDSRAKPFEVFLTDNLSASVASYYVSKPQPGPLIEQVPAVVDKFAGPLFAAFDRAGPLTTLGSTRLQSAALVAEKAAALGSPPTPPQLLAFVRQVVFQRSRAGVEIGIAAQLPVTETDMTEGLDKLQGRLRDRGFAGTLRLSVVVDRSVDAIRQEASSSRCQPPIGQPPTGATPVDAAGCRAAMQRDLTAVLNQAAQERPANEWERDTLKALDGVLRSFVDGLSATTVTGKASLDNSPLTHVGFGLVSAFSARIFSETSQRAKVDKNVVSADPLPRSLQIVALNWSPWGYQSNTTRRWHGDAFLRPFVGVTYSPDIGIAGGVSFMMLSNLGLNVGYVRLFISRPIDSLELGSNLVDKTKGPDDKPTDEFLYSNDQRRDPLRIGTVNALFVGVSYNFK